MAHVQITGVPVRHTDGGVSIALDQYTRAYTNGRSVLVRPMETYDGWTRVLAAVTARSGPPVFVTDLAGRQDTVCGEADGLAAPLYAFHTSGSTGSPSAVVYAKSVVARHARAIAESLRLDAGITYVALPPPRFAYGLSVVNSHIESGVPVTFTDATWTLPGLTRIADETEGDIALYALPQHVPALLSARIDPQRLVRLIIAGGRISAAGVSKVAERFPRLRLTNMYGQAEMGPRLSMWDGDPAQFVEGMIGRALPGVTLRVEAGSAGGAGRLMAASPYAMDHILRAPYTTPRPGPGAGEIATGDLAFTDEDGTLRHAGRADHVLNVAGTKVDLARLHQIVTEVARPLAVKVHSKTAAHSGDVRPVVEIVPGPDTPERTGPVRKSLAAEFGRLAGLFDITYVQELTLKESGK